MDNGRLLQEAQLIAAEFKFFMVKGNLEHLFGYIYESSDGETKYPLEIKYTSDFPNSPPDIIFPQAIPNVPDEIELHTLNNWTSESHVVDAVRELAALIKKSIEEAPKKHTEPEKEPELIHQETIVEENTAPEPKPVESPPPTDDQYLMPDTTQYPYEQDEYINPDELPQWTEDDQVQPQSDLGEEQYVIPDSSDQYITPEPTDPNQYLTPEPTTQPESTPTPPPTSAYEAPATTIADLGADPDVQVSTEAAIIQQEYAIDYVGKAMGIVEVYLTITIEQTFIVRVDFSNFPKRPTITVQDNLRKILGDVNSTIELLKNWNERRPTHVVEVIREIENKLWFLSDIQQEMRMIAGEYKSEMIDGLISNLRVSLFTYGFKEYTLDLEISKYPAQPAIGFSTELSEILPFSPDELMAYKNWKKKESHVVDILREISWLVDKASRISFEIDLLKGGAKKVDYDKTTDKFLVEIGGQLKTKDLNFKFEVYMHDDYPISAPDFKLLSELEEYEDIKKKINDQISSFTSQWHPFNYLIDLFNQISKTIFAESIISCVICHKIDCVTCGLKISSSTGDEHDQCQTQCPSCERLYHTHCWNQTIISFGKCGFCLRPPPEHMKPQM